MNKHGLISLGVLVIGAGFAGPATAGDLFRVNVIKCGAPVTTGDCGFFPPSPLPLAEGEIRSNDMGEVRVDLIGAAPDTTYKIYVGSFFIGGGFVQRYPDAFCCRNIGTVTTDASGNFDGAITTSPGAEFVFPAGTSLAQPSFVFTYIPVGGSEQVVYTTGFAVVAR
jgi:hypothetical protein